MRMNCHTSSFGLPLFRLNTGFHWRGSVRSRSTRHGGDSHNAGKLPTTADPLGLFGRVMDIHATVLESGTSHAPENFRSVPVLAQ